MNTPIMKTRTKNVRSNSSFDPNLYDLYVPYPLPPPLPALLSAESGLNSHNLLPKSAVDFGFPRVCLALGGSSDSRRPAVKCGGGRYVNGWGGRLQVGLAVVAVDVMAILPWHQTS